MNVRPGGDELFHAGSWSDERTDEGADRRLAGQTWRS